MGKRLSKLSKDQIQAIFEIFKEGNPHPKGELNYTNTYTLLVAVVLSAQATDKGVNKATERLFREVDSPAAMLALGEEGLKAHIATIGLYQSKARYIMALSARLLDHFDGQVPPARQDLESLPGVGRKTANVVLNIAFGQPTIAVDTHLFRVSNRTGLAPGKTPLEVEEKLTATIPPDYLLHAHHWLILHGRYICQARRPLCAICPIKEHCLYPQKTV